jgi:hypothetical protein
MMKLENLTIKLETKGETIKSWEIDKADKVVEQSVIEMIDADCDLVRRLRRERGTAEVEM